jgi:hypothetical protein
MSRRRPCLLCLSPEVYAQQVSAGCGAQHAYQETSGTREARLCSPGQGSAARISRRRKRVRHSGRPRGHSTARIVATNNATGGKDPCGGHVEEARTREGMPGRPGAKHPDGRPPIDKVRQLQRRLWVAAKRSPARRFHALMDRIWRADILQEAWRRVKRNRGSAGERAVDAHDGRYSTRGRHLAAAL